MTTQSGVDLLAGPTLSDPYPEFARLRAEDPAHYSKRHGGWLVTRYDDVRNGFHDHEHLSSDRITPFLESRAADELRPVFEVLSRWMVFRDPPDHGRLRKLVHLAFTPRAVEALRRRMQVIVDEMIDDLQGGGTMDVVRDFAYPLPATVIAEMLGAPADDRDLFKAWSDDITPLLFGGTDTPDRHERALRGTSDFVEYVRDLIHRSRAHGGTSVLDALVATTDEGERLSNAELEATALLLLFAGHETTTNLITNTLFVLLQHEGERARLLADPALVAAAVEETLRFEGPAKSIMRWVKADCELHGRRLERGDRVFLMMGSANRDPTRFPDPDRYDLGRDHNQHLGFGHGPHYCLGASLARAETQIAVGTALRRLPAMRLTAAEPEWVPQILSRGLRSLPVDY